MTNYFSGDPTLKYPFFYRPMYTILEDGWTAFRPETEFSKLLQSDEWRISHVNSDFTVSLRFSRLWVKSGLKDSW